MAQTDKLVKAADKYEHKAKHYESKTEHFEAKLSNAQFKASGKPKTTHTLITYAERNEVTGKKELHFRMDKETVTNYSKPRGLVHKLDAHFKTENILPPSAQKIANFAGIKANALVIENWALKGLDAAKSTARPLTSMAKVQATNAIYSAGMRNTGFAATTKTVSATKSVLNSVHKWRVERKAFNVQNKGQKLEYKRDKFQTKVDKFELKAATVKERAALGANNTAFGLSPKISRAEKKKSWKKVFDGNNKSSYLQKPTGSGTIDKLERKQYNAAKKVYQTRTVKEAYVNTATGKVQTRTKKVVDTSAKKKPKLKKPDSLAFNLVSAAGASLRSVGLNQMAQSDEASVQAAGKALQFSVSEMPKMRAAGQQKAKLKMDKKATKANAKLEKASSKLQVEKSNPNSSNMNKSKKKTAMKKSQQKQRNAKSFKENAAKALKKAKTQAVDGVKKFFVKKAKYVVLGLIGLLIMLTLPLSFLGIGGGGGSTMTGGAAITVSSYLNTLEGLIKFNNDCNNMHWTWQDAINREMEKLSAKDTNEWKLITNSCTGGPVYLNGPLAGGKYVENEENVYTVIKHLYGGEVLPLTDYDITCFYAYFTVKYHDDDWASISSAFGDFFEKYYTLESRNEDVVIDETIEDYPLDVHKNYMCQYYSDGRWDYYLYGWRIHTVTLRKYVQYFRLYPVDDTITNPVQQYIAEQLKTIGDLQPDGETTGEKHYDMLTKSLGLHQVINFPVKSVLRDEYIDWSYTSRKFGTYGDLVKISENDPEEEIMDDFRYKKDEHLITSIGGMDIQLEALAGGAGVITEKTSSSITIEYGEEKIKVTYLCQSGTVSEMTSKGVGAVVEDGEHLFYANLIKSAMGDIYPQIGITTFCTDLNRYINPLLVVKSREL